MKANSIFLKPATGLTAAALFICLSAEQPSNPLFRSASAAKTGAAKTVAAKTVAAKKVPGAQQIRKAPHEEGFVISDQQGQIACNDATPEEAQAMSRRDPALQLREITPRTLDLQQQQTGLKIILRGTPQLDGFPAAKDAFLRAAAKWEAIIQDQITVIIDVDFGPTRFGTPFGMRTIGSTSGQILTSNDGYPDLRSTLISLASNGGEASLYNSLPNGVIPTDIGSTAGIIAPSALLRAVGFLNPVANPGAEPNFGNPPNIGFNSAFNFDFDPSDGVSPGQIDFDSTAVHEIGHLLGFTSAVGQKELNPSQMLVTTVWDLFRFRPGVNLSTFSTAQRVLSSGGDHVFFDGGPETAQSTGRPNGEGGDMRQSSHWKADEFTGQYIGIMDPTAAQGVRELITDNDLRVIDVLGYKTRTVTNQPGTAPVITAPAAIDFGVVPASTQVNRLLTLRNTGTAVLNITGVSSQSANFSITAVSNSFVIGPGGQETILVRLNATSAGNPTGTISITSNDPARGAVSIPARATIGAGTGQLSTVSAASFVGVTGAREQIVAGFGQSLATTTLPAPSLPLPVSLGGTIVRVLDAGGTQRDAPLFFVSPLQVNYLIPAGTANGPASVFLVNSAGVVRTGGITVAPVAPGLFTANAGGDGPPAAVVLRIRPDGSQVFTSTAQFDAGLNRFVPAPIDLSPNGDQIFLLLFGTGIRFRSNLSEVSVMIGGMASPVSFAGSQGSFAGLDQLNVGLSSNLPRNGEVDLMLRVDGANANVVRLNLR